MIIFSDNSGPIIWPVTDAYDPNNKRYFYINYMPKTRVNLSAYTADVDIIIPSIFNGCMYVCKQGGISNSTEPVFDTREGSITLDGTCKFKCIPYDALLSPGDTITASSWFSDTGVVLTNSTTISGITTGIRLEAVPTIQVINNLGVMITLPIKTVVITNHISVTRSSGRQEEFDKSLVIKVKDL